MPLHPEVALQLAAQVGPPDYELPIAEARRRALLAAELEWRVAVEVAGVEELVLEQGGGRLVARSYGITYASQHISNRIGHHNATPGNMHVVP
jgi:hypothetical protein